MGKWDMVRLGDVCTLKAGKFVAASEIGASYSDGLYPCYGGNGLRGYVNTYTHNGEYSLIGRQGALCGNVQFAQGEFYATEHAVVVQPNVSMCNRWIYYTLNHLDLNKLSTGAAQPGLTVGTLNTVEIHIPPLDVQQKIADVLDKASALIELRKAQLDKLDLLVKSQFIEMFGDPFTNHKQWKKLRLFDAIKKIEAGWSANGETGIRKQDEYAVLKVSAVTSGVFNELEYKVITEPLKKVVYPHKGDLLFSRANTRELVGATCLIFRDYPYLLLPDKLWRIQFKDNVNYIYMKSVLSSQSIRNALSNASTGTSGSMYNVSMNKFYNIEAPFPPYTLQNEFAAFVERVEGQKKLLQQSLITLELNYKSLMQKCFQAEVF